ncbi:MAG: adenylate/guanylate cyclase domain-containing protein [Tateyamaria sp.]|nr:adenylate/guanylate cyclase domain-containing protein [Tateyamaria sp.]
MKMSFKIFSTTLLVFLIMTASAVFSMLKIAEINEQLHLISKVYNPLRNLASEIEIIFLEENIEIERIEKIELEIKELKRERNQLNNNKIKEDIINENEEPKPEISDKFIETELRDLNAELLSDIELYENYFNHVSDLVKSVETELEKAQELTKNVDEKIALAALKATVIAIEFQHENFHERSIGLISNQDILSKNRLTLEAQLADDADKLIVQLDKLREDITVFSDNAIERAAELEALALKSAIIATIAAGLISIILSSIVILGLLRPMKALSAGVKRIEEGDLEIELIQHSRDEVGSLTKSFNSMAAGLRSTQQIKDTFGQYVDPRIVSTLLGNGIEAENGRKEIASVYFSDIVGFSGLSEKFTPSGIVKVLNSYFDLMSGSVSNRDGVIDKYIGDAIMAFWAQPFCEQEECAGNAVEAAVQNIKKLQEFQRELPELTGLRQGAPQLDQRIGLATGETVIGSIGSKNSKNYTIIGDTVNLAARLEAANKVYGTELLVCERTAQSTRKYEFRLIDKIRVYGKTEPNSIYTVINNDDFTTDEMTEIRDISQSAFSAYSSANFVEAVKAYQNILAIYPNDAVAKIFLSRIEILKNKDFNEGWDGVWQIGKS